MVLYVFFQKNDDNLAGCKVGSCLSAAALNPTAKWKQNDENANVANGYQVHA